MNIKRTVFLDILKVNFEYWDYTPGIDSYAKWTGLF